MALNPAKAKLLKGPAPEISARFNGVGLVVAKWVAPPQKVTLIAVIFKPDLWAVIACAISCTSVDSPSIATTSPDIPYDQAPISGQLRRAIGANITINRTPRMIHDEVNTIGAPAYEPTRKPFARVSRTVRARY